MKVHYCFLERFNNYFNRKIIKYDSLLEYQNNSKSFFIPEDTHGAMMPFDFNPNDNVMTEIIANEVPFDPDYFLLLDEEQNIIQRWFIMEQKRNRQGQWLYTLRRDVISDNLDNLQNAPIFVQKGMLPEDDPFIVNDEGMSLNQIKKSEIKLYDETGTAWLVGYIAKNAGGSDINVQAPSESFSVDYTTLEDIATDTGISAGVLSSLMNIGEDRSNPAYVTTAVQLNIATKEYRFTLPVPYTIALFYFDAYLQDPTSSNLVADSAGATPYICDHKGGTYHGDRQAVIQSAVEMYKGQILSQLGSILGRDVILGPQYEKLRNYIGRTIKYNGVYYKFNIGIEGSDGHSAFNVSTDLHTCFENIYNKLLEHPEYFIGTDNSHINVVSSIETKMYFQLEALTNDVPQLEVTLSSGRNKTADQEFDIFTIPLQADIYEESAGDVTCSTNPQMMRKIASAIVLDENAKLYDLQLLPYCPIYNELIQDGGVNIPSTMVEHKDFDYIISTNSEQISTRFLDYYPDDNSYINDDGFGNVQFGFYIDNPDNLTIVVDDVHIVLNGNVVPIADLSVNVVGGIVKVDLPVGVGFSDYDPYLAQDFLVYHFTGSFKQGVLFYVKNSTFKSKVTISHITPNESKKVISNCYKYRLVSPNYQGVFDYNIAKNGVVDNVFNVFATYKPYTPFVKVAPSFSWLYGSEFGDNRGLICVGDFSLPRVSSAWESYELQNKNYQNIFNRDIQHLDFMQGIEMRNQLVSGGVGVFADTAKGAGAGAYVAGPYGALIGGTVGAMASGIGYAIDTDTLARTHRENKQLAIDKFNYQLGNIKALPYTLTTVGAFNAISKIYPILEIYCCSDKELEAFKNKIKYESMTVMRIGTLNEFMNFNRERNYFKGELIRNDEIADDTHILNAIYEELLKGVYI